MINNRFLVAVDLNIDPVNEIKSLITRLPEKDYTILSAQGSILTIASVSESRLEDLNTDFKSTKSSISFGTLFVLRRELISRVVEGEGKYIKLFQGRQKYGHVWLRLEPVEDNDQFVFENKIKRGRIPSEYLPAIQKGINRSLDSITAKKYPIVNVRCILIDGSFHEIDSSADSFESAAQLAIESCLKNAQTIFIEPIVDFHLQVQNRYGLDIIDDLEKRDAKISRKNELSDYLILSGKVAVSNILGYQKYLIKKYGYGPEFSYTFSHYEVSHDDGPAGVVAKI